MFWNIQEAGIKIYLKLNFLITIVIKRVKMAPFEVLYERRCHTPLNWIEPGEKVIFGPDLVEEAESIVRRVQENMKAAKSRQETYANKRR
jgi:hypothetical protein